METKLCKIHTKKFNCDVCAFNCVLKGDYIRHLNTSKHKVNTHSSTENQQNLEKNMHKKFICDKCNKEYKERTGLWKHKKQCTFQETAIQTFHAAPLITNEVIVDILKQNHELHQMIIEQNKTIIDFSKGKTTYLTNNTPYSLPLENPIAIQNVNINNNTNNKTTMNTEISNNTVNSNNKTFNLQFFLNETCKDAMNINEFVDSLKIQLSDVEDVGRNGFVTGISNIIIKNLKALDVTRRPIHCSDQKREVVYIKNDNQWFNDSKESPENQFLKKVIKQVANKNISMIKEWKAKYPDCIYAESRKSDLYNKIMFESMDHYKPANSEKIIRRIAKEVGIHKN